jgi:hypothetical protein
MSGYVIENLLPKGDLLCEGNGRISSNCSSPHLDVLMDTAGGSPAFAHLSDLIDETVKVPTVHVSPSLLHVCGSVSGCTYGS